MTTDIIAATSIDIVRQLLDENLDHPDAWIPVKRSDLDIMAAAFERYRQLEANLANMIYMLNGAATVTTPPAAAYTRLPAVEFPIAFEIDWFALAGDDLDTQHARFVEHLTDGNITWRKLEDTTKRRLIYWIIWRIQHTLNDETITVNYYEAMKPDWAPKASSLYKHQPFSDWVVDAMEAHDTESCPFRG